MPTMNDRIAGHTAGKYPDSWYAATAPLLPSFPSLEGEETADVCVIGGGYDAIDALVERHALVFRAASDQARLHGL